jgi:small subunit ribosomal protein S1
MSGLNEPTNTETGDQMDPAPADAESNGANEAAAPSTEASPPPAVAESVVSPVGSDEPAVAESVVSPVGSDEPAVAESVVSPVGSDEPAVAGSDEAVAPSPPPPPPGPSAPVPPPPSGGPAPASPNLGKTVEGVVTAVSADEVELTLDDGRHAVISRRNFGLHNEAPSEVLSVGDRAFGVELAREDPKNRVVLSRSWALKRQAWTKLIEHGKKGETVRCRVVSASRKGLVVDAGVRGFVPASHLELSPVQDFEPYLDQTLDLKILEIDPRREKLVLSRRAILQRAQRKERQEFMSSLKVGEVRRGTVQSLADYGAFVDLGGVSGLVHLSELSWYRVGKPADVVSVGDEVEVKVLDVKVKKRRIGLSIRQTTKDPLKAIEPESILVGTVTRLVDFGAFVLIEGFEGLVHLSELAEYRVSSPEAVVAPGDEVRVKVLSVDPSRRRIELSIRRAVEFRG